MPTSTSTITRTELIRRAFRRIGVRNPSTQAQADAVALLNDIVKGIDRRGRWLWTVSNTETNLTLVNGTRSYGAATPPTGIQSDILELENVELYIGTSYVPIDIVDKTESLTTFEREGTGQPVKVHLAQAPELDDQRMHFFPTPNAAFTAKYTYRRPLYVFTNASDNPDFPQEWNIPLAKVLSSELAPEFGVPLNERVLLTNDANQALKDMGAAAADPAPPQTQVSIYY